VEEIEKYGRRKRNTVERQKNNYGTAMEEYKIVDVNKVRQ
jgi:hypothetical protein